MRFGMIIRRSCCILLATASVMIIALGVTSHVRGLWAVIPLGETRAVYLDSYDGIISIGWHFSDPPEFPWTERKTGVWRAGTDLTGTVSPYYGQPSSTREPQIRSWYIDVRYIGGQLPWLDTGGLGVEDRGGSSTHTFYLVVSHWLAMAMLTTALAGLWLWTRHRARSNTAGESARAPHCGTVSAGDISPTLREPRNDTP